MVNLNPASPVSIDLSSLSSQELKDKLSQAFAETLQEFGIDPSSFKLTIQPTSGQTNGAAPAIASKLGFNALVPTTAATAPAPVSSPPAAAQHWYADDPVDNVYWSKQPTAVQQLREIDDPQKRDALGRELAAQGYQIDVPIMIWGWDAGKTMALRQQMGYTWIPSALQNPVSAAPGISGPGLTPYDPNHPPSGSIAVA